MIACPVNAYEKHPLTGIVKHLDDQCFGCQYCTLACPYDVPKYHAGKGIVRKCDMCSQRLAVDEPPACVQACPHEAIVIRIVNRDQIIEDAEAAVFLPAAPDPQHTFPTTTYKTTRPFPRNLLPADYFRVNPQHAHWPLVVMLVLTQMSVGAFVAGLTHVRLLDTQAGSGLQALHAINSLAFGLLALSASVFHLGRPQFAFRAVLGLRHSWLSREIVAFGLFAKLAMLYAGALLAMSLRFEDESSPWVAVACACASPWMGWAVAASGMAGIFCSVMIYVFTRRECWSFTRTAVRFVLTAALLGLTAAWLSVLVATLVQPSAELLPIVARARPRAVSRVDHTRQREAPLGNGNLSPPVICADDLAATIRAFASRRALERHAGPLCARTAGRDRHACAIAQRATGAIECDLGLVCGHDGAAARGQPGGRAVGAKPVLRSMRSATHAGRDSLMSVPKCEPSSRSLIPPLVDRSGPLTHELLLEPARFVLGMIPAGLQADAVAGSVCGFCSTGCNLNIHLRDSSAVGLTPAANYPVNLGMACPKGWEALAVLDAPDRATTPLLRGASGRMEPVGWDIACAPS